GPRRFPHAGLGHVILPVGQVLADRHRLAFRQPARLGILFGLSLLRQRLALRLGADFLVTGLAAGLDADGGPCDPAALRLRVEDPPLAPPTTLAALACHRCYPFRGESHPLRTARFTFSSSAISARPFPAACMSLACSMRMR